MVWSYRCGDLHRENKTMRKENKRKRNPLSEVKMIQSEKKKKKRNVTVCNSEKTIR